MEEIIKKDTMDALIFLGAKKKEISKLSYIESFKLLRKYEQKIIDLGIDLLIVKEVYNDNITLSAKKKLLKEIINKKQSL